ncbi:unnamed protein product [Withania somnifera]
MAAGGVSSAKQRNPRAFMTVLSSAACEWFLLFMLLLNAALSYLITKFASYCELQTPCMLCSRFDHIPGDKKTRCYKRHLCRNHKEDISFQVFCHIHGNLGDIRAMCEDCLVSFATENMLVKESDYLMMDKLGNKSFIPSSPGPWRCSCCQKTWRARSSAQRLLQLTSVGFGASKANVKPPMPRAPCRSRFSRHDSFKKIRAKTSGPESPRTRASTVDPLSHVGYTELKITSDSESEIQISDDDDRCSATHGKNDSRSEDNVQHGKGITQKLGTEPVVPENQSGQSSESKPSLQDQPMQLAASSGKTMSFQASGDFIGHGLAELDWESLSPNTGASALPEFISSYNISQSPNLLEDHHTSGEFSKSNTFLPRISDLSALSELVSVTNIPSSSSINIHEMDLTKANDERNNLTEKNNAKAPVHLDDSAPSISNQNNRADISVLSNRGRKVSDRLGEPSVISDSADAGESMKSLPQLSTSVMDESQISSLRNHDHSDDCQRSDASSSDGVHMPETSIFMGKDDSGNESADGFSVSEIEGESIVDRLKRQVEHDKRYVNALYKELEEERNASAVATNQAMAMITRLQEEKASLHMEALQYLRMMEEQAEYDMEALERANDLLAEREKELQDLEEELYRNKIPYELEAEDVRKEDKNLKGENVINENHSLEHVQNKLSGSSDSKSIIVSKIFDKSRQFNVSICNFEDEKLRISKHLENLEKKLFQISGRQAADNVPCNGYSEKIKKDVDNQVKKQSDDGQSTNCQQEEISSSSCNDFSKSNGDSIDKPAELEVESAISGKKNHLDIKHCKVSSLGGEVDGTAIGNEISALSGRLQALENDCKFFMCAFNSLQNEHEGIQLIKEIAHQLQEIRKIEFNKR